MTALGPRLSAISTWRSRPVSSFDPADPLCLRQMVSAPDRLYRVLDGYED
jgi:hypothetical protein